MKKKTISMTEELEVVEYYKTHTISDTCHFFNFNNNKSIKEILDRYNISLHSKEKNKELKKIKTQQTLLKNYGVTNISQIEGSRDKTRQTKQKKYGDAHYNNMSKNRETKLHKHGNENYNNSQKMKETRLQKYGVTNFFQRGDIHLKALQRCATEDALNKKKKTCQDKYKRNFGFDYEKSKETCIKKYGTPFISQNEEIKAKSKISSKQVCEEKYGISAFCLLPACQKACRQRESKPNIYWENLLENNSISFSREFRIESSLYDFKLDSNILLEINPSATHNSTWGIRSKSGIPLNYHKLKSENANNAGYRCIHVWDWDNENAIIHLLKQKNKIYARKCEIKTVNNELAYNFLNEYHVQGYAKASIKIGLFFNDELVSIMTFSKPRYNKNYDYELIRYCSKENVVGGAEKLMSYFKTKYNPESIISYCDNSKFDGDVYIKLGFKLLRKSEPRKHWYNIKTKQHITDNLLLQKGFDKLFNTNYGKGTSNEQLMLENKFVEVYDCGQSTYIL